MNLIYYKISKWIKFIVSIYEQNLCSLNNEATQIYYFILIDFSA